MALESIIHSTLDDSACCAPRLNTASLEGELDNLRIWHCPKCGGEYRATDFGPIRHWEPFEPVMVFQP